MAELPEYKRTTGIQGSQSLEDFAGAMRDYGASSYGALSDLGSQVAQTASNQTAKMVGVKLGQDPQGDLMPPITDFDKVVTETYQTQSHATLGLQASSLITDAQIQLASQPRLTPEMIAQTQQQVSLGLKSIYDMAPLAIRPQMEAQYGAVMNSQREQLSNRMISEGRQDQHNNIVAYSDKASQQAYDTGAAGDEKGAMSFAETAKKNK
jgi:hypothetical protein